MNDRKSLAAKQVAWPSKKTAMRNGSGKNAVPFAHGAEKSGIKKRLIA